MKIKTKIILQTEEYNQLYRDIKEEIIAQLKNSDYIGHIDDLGNLIGVAIGKHIANKNIMCFQKEDFIMGLNHGYSLEDGTHG